MVCYYGFATWFVDNLVDNLEPLINATNWLMSTRQLLGFATWFVDSIAASSCDFEKCRKSTSGLLGTGALMGSLLGAKLLAQQLMTQELLAETKWFATATAPSLWIPSRAAGLKMWRSEGVLNMDW